MSAPHKLSLAVQYASIVPGLPARAQFRRWFRIALQRDVGVTLRIVDETEGRELNKNYRGKDYATNVLTFVYDDDGLPAGESGPLYGDVIICAQVVAQEALTQHKDLHAHYAHLTIHAALHLQGYDHESDAEAHEMEALERSLMLKLRYPDPYQI
jgi:probable rRNA maturation factor